MKFPFKPERLKREISLHKKTTSFGFIEKSNLESNQQLPLSHKSQKAKKKCSKATIINAQLCNFHGTVVNLFHSMVYLLEKRKEKEKKQNIKQITSYLYL